MRFLRNILSQNVWSKWLGNFICKKKMVDKLPPYQGGGGMISEVLKEKVTLLKRQQNLRLEQCKPQKLWPSRKRSNLLKK